MPPDPKAIVWDTPHPDNVTWDDGKPNSLIDAARSIPGGLGKGVAAMAAAPGMVGDLMGAGMRALGIPMRDTSQPLPDNMTIPYPQGNPSTAIRDMGNAVGGFYQPQTATGKYAETAASFAPALIGGEAGLGAKLLGRVLAPAGAVEAAGAAIPDNHPYIKTAAQIAGALLAHGSVAGARAGISALSADQAPGLTAEKYLAKIAGEAKATPETVQAKTIPGRGQLGAETLGPQGVAMLATLGRRGGDTAEALTNALTLRNATAPSRIMDDYATAAGIHPEAAQGNIDALVDAGRAQAAPLFKQALSLPGGAMTPELQELSARPVVKTALSQAATDIRNDGGDPARYGLHFDESGNATQVLHPTAEAWDLAKKALGQSVERDAFGNRLPDSKSPGNYRIANANRALSAAMSDAIPGYGEALSQSGDYLSLRHAFETGQKHILDAKTTAAQVADHISDMSPAELSAYKGGIANEIFTKAQNARLAPRLLNTPSVAQKLTAALGADSAQKFMTGIQQEMELAKTGGRMMPGTGSITSDALLAAGDQDHAANLAAALQGAKAMGQAASGNIGGAALSGISAIRHFAPDFLRSGGMSADVRNSLGALLRLPPEDFAETLRRIQQQGQPSSGLARALQP